jgi:hypothetical protein
MPLPVFTAEACTVLKQLQRRERFLKGELDRDLETLRAVEKEVGHPFHEAVWMLKLIIEQFRTELSWLCEVMAELPHRAHATNPAHASKNI